eukprot:242145-Pelagomonas_calceolata.AAC.1
MLRHSTSEPFSTTPLTLLRQIFLRHPRAPRSHRHRLLLVLQPEERSQPLPSMFRRVLEHTRALPGDTAWRCLVVIPPCKAREFSQTKMFLDKSSAQTRNHTTRPSSRRRGELRESNPWPPRLVAARCACYDGIVESFSA